MILRQGDEFVAECNSCGAEFSGGCEDDFRSFVDELKTNGWKISRDDEGEWEHYCESCSEE